MAYIDAMRGVASVREQACLMRRKADSCTRCRDVCPTSAVVAAGNSVTVGSGCIGCGRCAAACPTGAILVPGFASTPAAGRSIRLECQRVPEDRATAQALRPPCLGGLDTLQLLELRLAAGDAPIVLVDRGWCSECPAGGVAAPWRDALRRTNELLAGMGLPPNLLATTERAPLAAKLRCDGGPAMSRRGLFRMLAAPTPTQPPAPRFPDEPPAAQARLALVQVVGRLAARHGTKVPAGLLPAIEVAASCRDHGICAAMCPTGALVRESGETTSGLSFDATRCVDCSLCAEACPTRALRLTGGTGSPGRQTLILHTTAACRRCGADVLAGEPTGLCDRCRAGRRYFTDFLPPGHAAAGNAGRNTAQQEGVSI